MKPDSLYIAILVTVLLVCVCHALFAQAPKADVHPFVTSEKFAGYKLAWAEEFNGKALDTELWSYHDGQAHNVSVADGRLRMTGGRIISKWTFKYGYYEARIKCPAGKGWQTAFRLAFNRDAGEKPQAAQQEIGICEQDSSTPRGYAVSIQQWLPAHKAIAAVHIDTPDLSKDFHIWGCEFTPKQARFFFDGKLVASKDVSSFPHDEMSILLASTATGQTGKGNGAGAQVDWVRCYEQEGGTGADWVCPCEQEK